MFTFFFRARAEKGIARHIDASSVVSTLIDNGKLANQIARLAEIEVKYMLNIQDKRGDVNSEAGK